jgi:membrane-associated HD superfamily phosphohydrolase
MNYTLYACHSFLHCFSLNQTLSYLSQMKKSDSKYDEVSVDDTVSFVGETMRDDVLPDVRLASHDIRKQRGMIEEDEDMDNKSDGRILDNTVDLAADFIKSKILQDAITHLVTSIIQSDEFKNACQTLLKTLWNDLINDPETTAQVVQLLNNAIQDDEIKAAVQDLVKQLIADEQVYAEFTKLLVRLASEEEVRYFRLFYACSLFHFCESPPNTYYVACSFSIL